MRTEDAVLALSVYIVYFLMNISIGSGDSIDEVFSLLSLSAFGLLWLLGLYHYQQLV